MKKYAFKKLIAGISSLCVMAQALPAMSFAADTNVIYGDANEDGKVTLADAVLVMQALSNPNAYKLTAQGMDNADVYKRGDGVTPLTLSLYRNLIYRFLLHFRKAGRTAVKLL
ncbi:MAG: hypothetical protein NC177_11530 [Ruminococcus flavefaciens]|nr:hypothetical protein [Ruminococcus flavefaciens]